MDTERGPCGRGFRLITDWHEHERLCDRCKDFSYASDFPERQHTDFLGRELDRVVKAIAKQVEGLPTSEGRARAIEGLRLATESYMNAITEAHL